MENTSTPQLRAFNLVPGAVIRVRSQIVGCAPSDDLLVLHVDWDLDDDSVRVWTATELRLGFDPSNCVFADSAPSHVLDFNEPVELLGLAPLPTGAFDLGDYGFELPRSTPLIGAHFR